MNLLARFFTRILFHIGFAVLVIAASVSFIATNRQTLKDSLVEANVYEEIVPAIIDEAQNEGETLPGESKQNELPLDDPEIQAIIDQSIEPTTIQSTTETIVNATFNWLDGSNSELEFAVDLSPTRDVLIDNLATYAVEEASQKPVCTSIEQAQYENVFDIACKPPGFSATQIRQEVEVSLQDSELLEEWIVTQDTFKSDDGKKLTDDINDAPKYYQTLHSSVWIASGIFTVIVVLFVLARRPLKNGLNVLGRDLFGSGLFGLISIGALKFAIPNMLESGVRSEGALEEIAIKIVELFADKVVVFSMIITAIAAVVGLILILLFRRPKPLENARANS